MSKFKKFLNNKKPGTGLYIFVYVVAMGMVAKATVTRAVVSAVLRYRFLLDTLCGGKRNIHYNSGLLNYLIIAIYNVIVVTLNLNFN